MKIIAVKHGLFRDRIKVEADKDEYCKSIDGTTEWFLKKGQATTILVPKKKMFQVNEEISFEYCVIRDMQSKFFSYKGDIPCKKIK